MGTYTDLLKLKPTKKDAPSATGEVLVADFSTPPPPPKQPPITTSKPETEPSERKSERTEKRSELPVRRRTKRYSFEFYDDQLTRLKQLKYEAELSGESVTLSDMAREAFDLYLKKKK